MSERYVAFYSARPFWAIEPIDFSDRTVKSEFHRLMQEIVFDYEHSDFKLKVCRDGKILLQIPRLERQSPLDNAHDLSAAVNWWSDYLDYLNSLYLLLDSCVLEALNLSYIELSELTRNDAARVRMEGNSIIGENIATQSYVSFYQMGAFLSMYGMPPQFDPRMIMRRVFPKEVFVCLVEKISIAFADRTLVSNLATIAKALSEYKAGNYDVALILAWFVTESLVSAKWQEYLQRVNKVFTDGSKRINSDRMKVLTDGSDFPISVISNHLELVGELSTYQFRKLDAVRRYRNKVVHQDPRFTCASEHAKESIDLALELALEGSPLHVELNYAYGVHGP